MKYALDTNVVLRYLRNDMHAVKNINNALANKHQLYIPKIVDYEVRRGFKLMRQPSPRKEEVYELLIQRCPVVEINNIVWECAMDVYKDLYNKSFTVGELDILIAAFYLVHECALVTNNTKDFVNIERFMLFDWTQSSL